MLTARQAQLLTFIDQTLRSHGIAPTYAEMCVALRLKSKSGVHRLVLSLEERGYIRRLPRRARAMEVLSVPDNFRPDKPPPATFVKLHDQPLEKDRTRLLPNLGRIAAGNALEATGQPHEDLCMDTNLLHPDKDYFALQVTGDSMIGVGIYDGDTVICERVSTARNGDIIVALIDNNQATLKRLRRKGRSVALEAENPLHETMIINMDRITIQGKLHSLYRRY